MALPEDAKLLGASPEPLEMRGSRAQAVVRLNPEGQRTLATLRSGASAGKPTSGVYLALEDIRGDFDATVLAAYLNLPEGARPGDHPNLDAGSVGLYGLSRASVPDNENGGHGLTFFLDISRIVMDLLAANSSGTEEIRVTLVSTRPLPDSVVLTIGRISLFALPAA